MAVAASAAGVTVVLPPFTLERSVVSQVQECPKLLQRRTCHVIVGFVVSGPARGTSHAASSSSRPQADCVLSTFRSKTSKPACSMRWVTEPAEVF